MPRQAKIISNAGIYHIMTKGINKEKIFKKEMNNISKGSLIKQK